MYLHDRVSAHGVMGCRINPSWWIHYAISHFSQCSMTGVTKAVVCAHKRTLTANWKEQPMWQQQVSSLAI